MRVMRNKNDWMQKKSIIIILVVLLLVAILATLISTFIGTIAAIGIHKM